MSVSEKDSKINKVQARCGLSNQTKEISYVDTKVIGNGSFGVVYQAKLCDTNEVVAVKKVLQDRRYKNRELQIMCQLDHPNIVKLQYYFHVSGDRKDEVFLNLVLEYVPETVYRIARRYVRQKEMMPIIYVKLYIYQLLRSLAYIHNKGICHRDIKPQNLLLDPSTGVLKLCDFGSAKILVRGEPNVAYICSRYYRAPELIFGATEYTCQIDIWSAGCVLAELLLGQPIFPGESGVDQLVEIIKVLGTPSRDQIHQMNPDYREFRFPQIRQYAWSKVFSSSVPAESIQLVSELLDYTPSKRLKPLDALLHTFFDELRQEGTCIPNDKPLPPLFNLTSTEQEMISGIDRLVPPHARSSLLQAAANTSDPPPSTEPSTDRASGDKTGGETSLTTTNRPPSATADKVLDSSSSEQANNNSTDPPPAEASISDQPASSTVDISTPATTPNPALAVVDSSEPVPI